MCTLAYLFTYCFFVLLCGCVLAADCVCSIEQEEFVTMMMLEHVKEPDRYALIQLS
jgi:hypothetical protein